MSPGSSAEEVPRSALGLVGELRRTLHAEARDVGDLVERAVLADALAELVDRTRLVEDVVDDLEEQAELGGEGAVRLHVLRAAQQRAAHHRGLDEAAGLERVQRAQVVVVGRLAGHVHVLAADHALDAGGGGDLRERGEHRGAAAGLPREDEIERLREEAVAGQDGHVLAVGDVARGPAAAQRVVVDGRQVVVDERVRVDELQRGRGGQHACRVGAAAAGRRQRQHRPDALAAREQRVAHGLGQPERRGGRRRSRAPAR